MRARSAALAAISCVEAEVSCVEAETCSADAEDCSATAATSATSDSARAELGGDLLDRGGDLGDPRADALDGGVDAQERVPGLLDGGDALFGARGAVGDDADDLAGLPCISAISPEISDAARPDSSASLRTSSATTANPRPCSPARAASMAAFSASRLVCSASAGDRGDDPADLLGARGEVLDRGADLGRGGGDVADRLGRRGGRGDALTGDLAGVLGGLGGRRRGLGARGGGGVASCTASRVDSTIRTWRSAPWATSVTALAISPTARPASSEELATCWEPAETFAALRETSPISTPSWSHIAL